jgi:hypothetical protein
MPILGVVSSAESQWSGRESRPQLHQLAGVWEYLAGPDQVDLDRSIRSYISVGRRELTCKKYLCA